MTMFETRAKLYHDARNTTDAGIARRIWDAVDRIESRMANERQRAAKWPDDDDKRHFGQTVTHHGGYAPRPLTERELIPWLRLAQRTLERDSLWPTTEQPCIAA